MSAIEPIARRAIVRVLAGLCLVAAWSGTSCLSSQTQSSFDGDSGNLAASGQPFIEAYIEYPGPRSKWAGPGSFILHVSAKNEGTAQITTTPPLLGKVPAHKDTHTSVWHRAPASSPLSSVVLAFHPMNSEEARAQLGHLVAALQDGAQASFSGCMSPVRVRLVRTDGGLFERQGCRSDLGWPRVASETVSYFIEASLHGTPVN